MLARYPDGRSRRGQSQVVTVERFWLAMDPRVPDELEQFRFELNEPSVPVAAVQWLIDNQLAAEGPSLQYRWPIEPGRHQVSARVQIEDVSHSFVVGSIEVMVQPQ